MNPELSPPQYGWGRLFFQNWFRRGPLRAAHGIPSSTEGISDSWALVGAFVGNFVGALVGAFVGFIFLISSALH